MSEQSEKHENAMTWGERELDHGSDGKMGEFARASGAYVRRFAWWIVALALLIVIIPRTIKFVPAGHGAVLWKRFNGGTVHQNAIGEGLHVIWPWNNLVEYELRVTDFRKDYDALANDGLPVKATVSLRYRVNPERVSYLYQQFGEHYEEVLISPQIGSTVREVMSRYPADQLYAYARARIEGEISEIMTDRLDFAKVIGVQSSGGDRRGYVFFEGLAVLDLELPKTVTTAIERKMAQDQEAQEYEFKVKREQMETERRAIEVDGIKNYAVVAQAPWFRDYLRYVEIEANYDMAKSNNAKLIFLGNQGTPPNLNMTVPHP